MTPMHPSKFIDLNSDDDDPSGGTGSDTVATAVKLEVKTEPQPCALLGALMSSEPRVMDKKDKLVVTTGLKVMQHEDEVMKAMVGVSHLSESVHMLVLKDPTINLSSWNDLHVMTIDPNWEDTCKKLGLIPEPWTGCSVHGKAHLETDPRCPLWSRYEPMHGCGYHPILGKPGWQGLLVWGWLVPVCCRRSQRCFVQAGSGLERGSSEHDSKNVPWCLWYAVSFMSCWKVIQRSFT